MKEEALKQFFLDNLDAEALASEVSRSILHHNEIETSIAVGDMNEDFTVTRQHLLHLADATRNLKLSAEALNAIAFALITSDRFEFDEDEVVLEVLYDWSAPEINFPLNEATLRMHSNWLTGETPVPDKSNRLPVKKSGKIVSIRRRVASH